MFVTCENETCMNFADGHCKKNEISIGNRTFSGFRSGEREWSTTCKDYMEEQEDD